MGIMKSNTLDWGHGDGFFFFNWWLKSSRYSSDWVAVRFERCESDPDDYCRVGSCVSDICLCSLFPPFLDSSLPDSVCAEGEWGTQSLSCRAVTEGQNKRWRW